MKVCMLLPEMIARALKHVLNTLLEEGLYDFDHADTATADIVIVENKRELEKVWKDDRRHFIVFATPRDLPRKEDSLPANVHCVSLLEYLPTMLETFFKIKESISLTDVGTLPEQPRFETGKLYEPRALEGDFRSLVTAGNGLTILVIDDTPENLEGALSLLGEQHYVMLAQGFAQGRELIEARPWDVVLTDLHMPLGSDAKTALSSDAIKIGETVPCGMFLVFRATQLGAKVAVVTDANHHQDWTSALFDTLRQQQEVNGQTVLLINHMGKKWDEALEALMSIP